MTTRKQVEDALVHYSQALHSRGWVANHDGNASVRLDKERFLATPTGVSKAQVNRSNLLVVNGEGQRLSGRSNVFSEISLHLYVYRQRPDVNAVVHAHPPTATGFAVAGLHILPTLLAEPVVSLGECIPLVPFAPPKTAEFTLNMQPFLHDADVLLLEHHGVLAFGPDLETAFLRMELVEHLAAIQLAAHNLGRVRTIPNTAIAPLLKARTAAGLGSAGRAKG